ncbi:MAG: SDR family oxidoreductase [Candidatus Dormibacteria bacterium]
MSDPPTAGGPVTVDRLAEWSRRLAADPSWVVYGGGNSSMKGEFTDPMGHRHQVLWVKGSGVDMRSAAPADFPMLDLAQLQELGAVEALDEQVVSALVERTVLQPSRRRPSIETLLHALVPHAFVFHVHADAICALANHADGKRAVAEVLGDRFAFLGWVRPGLTLAQEVARLVERDGVVLAHHGLVTWAEDPERCYAATARAISAAQSYLGSLTRPPAPAGAAELTDAEVQRLLLALRGRLSQRVHQVLVVDSQMRAISDRGDVSAIVQAGVSSADHMLWTGPWSCAISDPRNPQSVVADIDGYEAAYDAYLGRHGMEPGGGAGALGDRQPRVLLVPGLGGVATGPSEQVARRRAEVALHTHTSAAMTLQAFGGVEPLSEATVLDWDRFPPEVAKLKDGPAVGRLAGRVFIVTGAASGIGRAVALVLSREGASVVGADIQGEQLLGLVEEVRAGGDPEPASVVGDLTDEAVISQVVGTAVRRFGGLDGAVLNAGIGVAGRLEDLSATEWRRALEVNLTSAFLLTREALRVLRTQGIGGSLVYVASKNAFGPGAGFGAYSVAKAGMIQLMRIAALEAGEAGIRANAVNPDAVFDNSHFWGGGLGRDRAAAHGVPESELADFYAARNLLHRPVTTSDVAATIAFLLSDDSSRTTGGVIPVDGGVASAFPR